MIHYIRSIWLIVSILYLGRTTAEHNQVCACLPREECSQVIGGKLPIDDKGKNPMSPCKDPGTLYCCTASTLDIAKIAGQELDKDRQLVEMIDGLTGNVGNNQLGSKENENSRQEKSIGGSRQNGLNLDNKLHDKTPDKVIIVYPENNTKHTEGVKDQLQIILPTRKQTEFENLRENAPESYKIEQSVKQSNEKLPPTLHVHKSITEHSKLHRLFPKRRPLTHKREKSTQNKENGSNDDDDDLDMSASEIDEISIQVVQPNEQTIKPPLRTLPRHLVRQQAKNEDPRQKGKRVHDLFRARSKNTTVIPEVQTNLNDMVKENITTANIPKDVVAENINVMVINDLMKTNYSSRHSSQLHSSSTLKNNLRHQLPTSTVASETQEQSGQKASPNADLALIENRQNLTAGTSQIGEERDNKAAHRKRLHTRRPGLRTQLAVLAAKNQEQTSETTSQKPSPRDSFRKSLSSQRSRVLPQVQGAATAAESTTTPQPIQNNSSPDKRTTQIAQNLKVKSTEPSSVFGARISRFRQRPSRVETTSATSVPINKNIEEPTQGAMPVSEFKSSEVHPEQATFPLQKEFGEVGQEPSAKTQDLESSGTTNHQARVLFQGDFHPPTEMVTGFEPMLIPIQDLKTVGPLPGGFLQQSKSFNENPDEFGLSLPSDIQLRSMSQSFDDFDYNSMLLPPVFLPPQNRVPTEPTPTTNVGFETADLLPPVQLPMPLMKEKLSDRETITKIQDEFNVLKSQYDLLLSRYAETLSQYNDEYEKIIQSSKTTTDSQ